jgi:hypothetical protein
MESKMRVNLVILRNVKTPTEYVFKRTKDQMSVYRDGELIDRMRPEIAEAYITHYVLKGWTIRLGETENALLSDANGNADRLSNNSLRGNGNRKTHSNNWINRLGNCLNDPVNKN